jgi:hypothetical protein
MINLPQKSNVCFYHSGEHNISNETFTDEARTDSERVSVRDKKLF